MSSGIDCLGCRCCSPETHQRRPSASPPSLSALTVAIGSWIISVRGRSDRFRKVHFIPICCCVVIGVVWAAACRFRLPCPARFMAGVRGAVSDSRMRKGEDGEEDGCNLEVLAESETIGACRRDSLQHSWNMLIVANWLCFFFVRQGLSENKASQTPFRVGIGVVKESQIFLFIWKR